MPLEGQTIQWDEIEEPCPACIKERDKIKGDE